MASYWQPDYHISAYFEHRAAWNYPGGLFFIEGYKINCPEPSRHGTKSVLNFNYELQKSLFIRQQII